MFKSDCLNPTLSKFLCELGHTEKICVCDAGLPIPKNIERIDLAWKKNNPRWLDVCEFIKSNMNIEKIVLAKEIVDKNESMLVEFQNLFDEIDIDYIDHIDFKKELLECKGVIRTGEFSFYANCILQVGVDFEG